MSVRPQIPPRAVAAAWAPALAYMALIWIISSLTLPALPIEHVPLRDKGIHFLEYALLGLLVAHATLRTWPRRGSARTLALAFIVTTLFGLLDEIHQAFVPGRSSEALDVVADAAGAAFGVLARRAVDLVRPRVRAADRSPAG